MLATVSLHWLAGLYEGEGSFGFCGGRAKYAFAYLGMTDRDVVERAAKMLRAKVYLRPVKGTMTKPQHTIVLSGRRALGLMMTLYTMMGARRRDQIRTAIAKWRALPGTGCHERAKTACPRGHPYTVYNERGWRHCLVCRRVGRNARYRRSLAHA